MQTIFFRRMAAFLALIIMANIGYAQKTPWPQTFLWRISGNGLTKPSFLYGTIHLSDRKLFHFSDSLYRYLEQAEGFNIEIDADSMVNASVRKWSQNDNGRLLKNLLNKKEYGRYADKLSKTLGKPADKITTRDVWLAKNQKSAEAYKKGNMQSFMDLYLYGIAKKQGKIVGGIEDVEDQMDIIDNLFEETDLAYVTSDTLQETGMSIVDKLKEIYLRQNLNDIESLTLGSINQRFNDIVLVKRNLKMARRMDSLARTRSSFFAVGVAHLPGDTGVISLLRKKGFNVEPVFSSKKIAPQNYTYKTVDMPWLDFTHDLHLYQVQTPGALQPMDVMKEVMDMEYYYDVATGKVYYTAVINSVADINKKDSVFAAMIGRMASDTRTLVSKKDIRKQDYDGREVILKTAENQVLQVDVFMAGSYAYMAMILSKKSELNDKESKRFFESFTMTPFSSFSRPYIRYTDSVLAFSVKLPQEPVITRQTETESGSGELTGLAATDYSSGNSYAVTIRDTKAGNYIPNDSAYLEQIKTNLAALMKEDTVIDISNFQDYPALRMKGSSRADNVYYETLTVLRGNRSYFVMAQSKKAAAANTFIDSFFHSFTLNDYSRGNWKQYSAPDNSFTGWLPGEAMDEEKDMTVDTSFNLNDSAANLQDKKSDIKKDYVFYDRSTGTSYNIQRENFSDYYSSTGDSSLFTEAGLHFKAEGDSIISFALLNAHGDKSADVQIDNPGSSMIKKIRFILHGDTLYKVFTFTPARLSASANTTKFFNQFSISNSAPPTTLFTNKTGKLVADLTSSDSAAFAKASDYLYEAKLQKADLAAFYPLLIRPLKDFAQGAYNTNNRLIEAIADIADSSTVHFVMQNYQTLNGEPKKSQYSLLKLLVKMKQPLADEAVVKLFNSGDAPAGYLSIFPPALCNNLPLAKKLFTKIMSFTTDTTAALEYAYLVKMMLDSNYISTNELLPYVNNFITAAAEQKRKIKTDTSDYDYSLISVLDLFGALDNTTGNEKLQEYSKVNNLEIRYNAITWLIKNGQPLSSAAINILAASDLYRTQLYDTLKSAKYKNLFPATQVSQKLFAASYLHVYALEDDNAPTSIQHVREKIVDFKGKKQKFHLFKITFGEGEDATSSLGIAGPFALNGSEITSTNEATGIYWEEIYSAKEINLQFSEYLKSLEKMEE